MMDFARVQERRALEVIESLKQVHFKERVSRDRQDKQEIEGTNPYAYDVGMI